MKSKFFLFVFFFLSASILSAQVLENLPEKVPLYKVDIILHKRNHIKGYLVDVTDEALFIVNDKSMVAVALKDNCASCSVVHHRSIYEIKGRNSIMTKVAIGSAIVGAAFVWALSANSDGDLSERSRKFFNVVKIGIPAIILAVLINNNRTNERYDQNKLKVRSSKYQFFRKCRESVNEFIVNGRLNKSYTFYLGESFRMVKGNLIKKDIKEMVIFQDKSGEQIVIKTKEIKCVK